MKVVSNEIYFHITLLCDQLDTRTHYRFELKYTQMHFAGLNSSMQRCKTKSKFKSYKEKSQQAIVVLLVWQPPHDEYECSYIKSFQPEWLQELLYAITKSGLNGFVRSNVNYYCIGDIVCVFVHWVQKLLDNWKQSPLIFLSGV